MFLPEQRHPPAAAIVTRRNDGARAGIDGFGKDRYVAQHLGDAHRIGANHVVDWVAKSAGAGFDRRPDRLDDIGDKAARSLAMFDNRLDCHMNRAASFVPKHEQQIASVRSRFAKVRDRILQAAKNNWGSGDRPGDPNDKRLAETGVEDHFGNDARILDF